MVHDYARNVRQLRPRLQGRRSPRSHSPARSGARAGHRVASRCSTSSSPPPPGEASGVPRVAGDVPRLRVRHRDAYNRPLLVPRQLAPEHALLRRHARRVRGVRPGARPQFDASRRLESVRLLGLAMVVAGDALRKTAEITARHNFTHKIMTRRRAEHVVVRRGVYRHVRHPGYLGWFVWSVGTQVLLCNPACVVAFTVFWRSCCATGSRSRRNTSGACSRGSTPPTRRSRPRGYRASREPNERTGETRRSPGVKRATGGRESERFAKGFGDARARARRRSGKDTLSLDETIVQLTDRRWRPPRPLLFPPHAPPSPMARRRV